jgi:hypothetical protein
MARPKKIKVSNEVRQAAFKEVLEFMDREDTDGGTSSYRLARVRMFLSGVKFIV